MLELLKLLIDSISKVVPAFGTWRGDKKFGQMGAALFEFYTDSVIAVELGWRIVNFLKLYQLRMGQHVRFGNDPGALKIGSSLYEVLVEQSVQLSRLDQS